MAHLLTKYLNSYLLSTYFPNIYLLTQYLPTYLVPTCLPSTYLLTQYLPTFQISNYFPNIYLLTQYLSTYLVPTYLPNTYLLTYLLMQYLTTYLVPTYLPSTYQEKKCFTVSAQDQFKWIGSLATLLKVAFVVVTIVARRSFNLCSERHTETSASSTSAVVGGHRLTDSEI